MTLDQKVRRFEESPQLRFSKVAFRSKRPIEKGWVNRPYTYDSIQAHIHSHRNYGVLCGRGGLVVVDADEEEMIGIAESSLPPTFTVSTGGGGRHYYYRCPDIRKRIVLESSETHLGEIQAFGQQVIGPNSLHPNGNPYVVLRDLPIREMGRSDLLCGLVDVVRKPTAYQCVIPPVHQGLSLELDRIPLTRIIDVSEFRKAANGELYGPNPWHGSTTRANTWINVEKNVGYCFRHQAGINVPKAIALNIGLIENCSSVVRRSDYETVLTVARREYGLR